MDEFQHSKKNSKLSSELERLEQAKAERRARFDRVREETRKKILEYGEAAREQEDSRHDNESIEDEISEVHEGLDKLVKEIKSQNEKSAPPTNVHVHFDKPTKSDPPHSIRSVLSSVGVPKTVAAIIAAIVGVGFALAQACQGIPHP